MTTPIHKTNSCVYIFFILLCWGLMSCSFIKRREINDGDTRLVYRSDLLCEDSAKFLLNHLRQHEIHGRASIIAPIALLIRDTTSHPGYADSLKYRELAYAFASDFAKSEMAIVDVRFGNDSTSMFGRLAEKWEERKKQNDY